MIPAALSAVSLRRIKEGGRRSSREWLSRVTAKDLGDAGYRAAIGWRAAPFGFVAVVCLSGSVLRGQEASAAGRWRTIDDKTGQAKSIVRIIETNGVLEGRVEQVFSPPSPSAAPLCEKCSGDLKNKPIVGMTIMWDMKKDGAEYRRWPCPRSGGRQNLSRQGPRDRRRPQARTARLRRHRDVRTHADLVTRILVAADDSAPCCGVS